MTSPLSKVDTDLRGLQYLYFNFCFKYLICLIFDVLEVTSPMSLVIMLIAGLVDIFEKISCRLLLAAGHGMCYVLFAHNKRIRCSMPIGTPGTCNKDTVSA